MNDRVANLAIVAALGVCTAPGLAAQQKTIEPDLPTLVQHQGLQVFNRSVTALTDGTRKGLHLNENAGEGVAYIPGVAFDNGTIELDIRGKDVPQQSFVGLAFHGVDGTTYEAIYFRPFNFRTTDPARRVRAVQYVAQPTYPWDRLRAEHPGVYEQPVTPVPDPNGWFPVRVVVAGSRVSVFVGEAKEPSLVVERLSQATKGLVGLWVGNTSGGDFANLRIRPE